MYCVEKLVTKVGCQSAAGSSVFHGRKLASQPVYTSIPPTASTRKDYYIIHSLSHLTCRHCVYYLDHL